MSHFLCSIGKKNINALRVKCANVDEGCEWEGIIGSLEEHVTTCKFAVVPCPKECKDDNGIKNVVKKDLDGHLENCPNRDSKCEFCGEQGTYALTQIHRQTCTRKPLKCPNAECTRLMLRSEIQDHLDGECEYTEIPCKYRNIGCSVKAARRNIVMHEQDDDKLHLHLALDVVSELKSADISQKKAAGMTFKLPNYQQKKEQNAKIISPVFYTSTNGYSVAVRVDLQGHGEASGTHISAFALVLAGEHDRELSWPFQGSITFALLNQLEDKNHFEKTLNVEGSHNVQPGDLGRGYFKFVPHSRLSHDPLTNTQYLMDDTLYFTVSVEVANYKPWLECSAIAQKQDSLCHKRNETPK